MADVAHFTADDVQTLLEDKHVVVIGDSVQRSVYKDLVCLLREDRLLTLEELKEKGEENFQEDELLEGGVKTGLHNGTNYREVRKYRQANTTIMFYFVTRCYGEYMQSILDRFKLEPPHVIIMNSCLWDLHRYGKTANAEFIENIKELLYAIEYGVPDDATLFIWNATLPVRETVKAGFLPPGVDHTIPADDIRKANLFVRDEINGYAERFIFLDLHQTFYKHLELRVKDGVHWNDFAHRKITCLILSEIAKQWNFEIPPKSPLSPVHDEASSVGYDRSMNANPRSTTDPERSFDVPPPPPRNGFVGNGHGMNGSPMNNSMRMNGFPGNFPRGPLGPRANGPPGPRGNVPPRPRIKSSRGIGLSGPRVPGYRAPSPKGNSSPRPLILNGHSGMRVPGPRVNGPSGLRINSPPGLRPKFSLRPRMSGPFGPMGNDVTRNGLLGKAPIRNRPLIGPAGARNRRGRTRSCPRPPPPRVWLNGPPPFLNNNEYLPERYSLNETFPPAVPGKRKRIEEDDFYRPYKFPR